MSVVVVGGGPSGLAAAVELRRTGVGNVVVLDREGEAGGVPRHCVHLGFGLRDFHRVLGGPSYARLNVALAKRAGVEIRAPATATGWAGPTALTVTSARGVETLAADAVVLATGCRERPRTARLVAGTRPAGVFTTASLQQLVHIGHQRIGNRAVIVGAEHVSFSAVLTLARAGCETVAMVTEQPTHQTYALLAWFVAGRRSVPILTAKRVAMIHGRERVEAVELDDGRTLVCDTVVFSGDWIPDHELARVGNLLMDSGTRGPRVDQSGRSSRPGVFAVGNLVHAAESADVAALGGRAVGAAVADWLARRRWPETTIAIVCEQPVRWVWPNAIAAGDPACRTLRFRVDEPVANASLVVSQAGRALWRSHMRRLIPNRSLHVPIRWLDQIDPAAGPLRIKLG